jgi:hypothetical protein
MMNQWQQGLDLKATQFLSLRTLVTNAKALAQSVALPLVGFLLLGTAAAAKELPNAPSAVSAPVGFVTEAAVSASPRRDPKEAKPIDTTFVGLALVSAGSTFADSYTTLFARQNWLAGKKGVCNMEVESAYLYGTHPTVGRAYAVASVKSVGSWATAYYLRKHHSRFWSAPLLANSAISLQGVTQNMIACN